MIKKLWKKMIMCAKQAKLDINKEENLDFPYEDGRVEPLLSFLPLPHTTLLYSITSSLAHLKSPLFFSTWRWIYSLGRSLFHLTAIASSTEETVACQRLLHYRPTRGTWKVWRDVQEVLDSEWNRLCFG